MFMLTDVNNTEGQWYSVVSASSQWVSTTWILEQWGSASANCRGCIVCSNNLDVRGNAVRGAASYLWFMNNVVKKLGFLKIQSSINN